MHTWHTLDAMGWSQRRRSSDGRPQVCGRADQQAVAGLTPPEWLIGLLGFAGFGLEVVETNHGELLLLRAAAVQHR